MNKYKAMASRSAQSMGKVSEQIRPCSATSALGGGRATLRKLSAQPFGGGVEEEQMIGPSPGFGSQTGGWWS